MNPERSVGEATPDRHVQCWVCGSSRLQLAKRSNLCVPLESADFRTSSGEYGQTGDIYRCGVCGFLECPAMTAVLPFYEELEDSDYESTRAQRAWQERQLLDVIARYRQGGRLLDIGAASGILVEEALKRGYQAIGVEPSTWLQRLAVGRGLPVLRGTFPHREVVGVFDVVTLVDVIEHVPDPLDLLTDVRRALAPGGIAVVVTPDVGSLAARFMGWRWWHYRPAHIGYFNRSTLRLALERAGFRSEGFHRPWWYLRGDYMLERLARYLPVARRLSVPVFGRLTIPLNLFDSIVAVAGAK